ncbi:hypothetical protein SAMN05444365_12111 [Micromonospora pattaloongensis]|uniref:Uncharacterized protein n=1 Tax=Micromonospora pattaloongensis TaxID=405436 RepID=A0A1H3T9Y3_9ACTN|nr:hypothetical protein [Micromonospora pattaloongensis]SDZ47072.1 hypothetical protein SAMN05444365_12111 [Micromonospora pattaloongensis]
MVDRPQLRLHEIIRLTYSSLTATVRCVAGTVRLGDRVELAPAGAAPSPTA